MNSLLFLILLFIPVVSCIACLFLFQSVSKSSQKYRKLILRLKEENKYDKWAHQHKQLGLLENLFRYFRYGVILLVPIGYVIEFVPVPKAILLILEIIGYTYWPLSFVLLMTMSRLHKKAHELQSVPSHN